MIISTTMVLSHAAEMNMNMQYLVAPGAPSREQIEQRRRQEEDDGRLAKEIQKQEDRRYRRLKAQYESEQNAEKVNQFAKMQRVSYHSKVDDRYIDAVVVGVHLDDGPDKPYYVSL